MEREASTQPDSDNIDPKTNEGVDTTALESQLPTLDDDLRRVRPASIPYSTKLKPGSQFGSYLLVSVLGEGGFGQVWESIDQRSGRRLALKLLTSIHQAPKELIERFKQEGRLAASLNHPHCVYIFGADEVEGIPLITMEMMNGTLQDQLKAHGPMAAKQAVDSIMDIVKGLEAAQKAGIIHRDIKPSNCFVDLQGRAKIGDFGLSKTFELDANLTRTGTFMGTPAFASPEQAKGRDIDFRSDIYSVGATLFALLTGTAPFSGKNPGEVLARVMTEEPEMFKLKSKVPPGLLATIEKCLVKQPAGRFQSYDELRQALIPFSSYGMVPAELSTRLSAFFVDCCYVVPLIAIASISRSIIFVLLLIVLYFTISEGLFQRTFGKRAFGLRIRMVDGSNPGLARVFFRSLILTSVFASSEKLFDFLVSQGRVYGPAIPLVGLVLMPGIPAALLFCNARRSNGNSGLHELLTQTRTVLQNAQQNVALALESAYEGSLGDGSFLNNYGPYETQRLLSNAGDSRIVLAHDPILKRNIWIRLKEATTQNSGVPKESPARLKWLQRGVQQECEWTAYEAPRGIDLVQLVRDKGPVSWSLAMSVVRMLARELPAEDSTLSLHRIWIDDLKEPRWLDFNMTSGKTVPTQFEPARWKEFVQYSTSFLLQGRENRDHSGKVSATISPGYAEHLLHAIAERNYDYPEQLIQKIDSISGKPSLVDWQRRVGMLLVTSLFFMVYNLICIATGPFYRFGHLSYRSLLLIVLGLGCALPAAIFAFLSKGGFSYRLLHVGVRTLEGRPASRGRCFFRSLISWLPLVFGPAGAILVAICCLFCLWKPQRGVQDLLCGTVLVPE